jgi:hypothetical protein
MHVADASEDGQGGERYKVGLSGIYNGRIVVGGMVEEGVQRVLGFA